jgi:hypothetical protein
MKTYIGTKIIKAEPESRWKVGEHVPDRGYRVVYKGGYESWSPAATFEKAYRLCDAMTFGLALEAMKMGKKVQRAGWNGKGMWLELQRPDAHSKMTLPYIFLSYPDDAINTPGARVPWLASQTDMLAEDWRLIEVDEAAAD